MRNYKALIASGALLWGSTIHAKGFNTSAAAFNPQLNNTIPNGNNGPTLFYNGSGPVPPFDSISPPPEPLPKLSAQAIEDAIFQEIISIMFGNDFTDDCTQCVAVFQVLHIAALVTPISTVTNLLIRRCVATGSSQSSCEAQFAGTGGLGPFQAQLLAKMSMATGDMQAVCFFQSSVCERPAVIKINEDQWFSPKPSDKTVAPPPSGKTIDVLHISDTHFDPRYDIGSEAACSQGLCCRSYSTNTNLNTDRMNPSIPASRFGEFACDTPADLGISAFTSMSSLINMSSVAFAIFTGDLVSHDGVTRISREYVEYEEKIQYETFKANLGDIPVYPTLGNHDSFPQAYNTPNNIRNDSHPNTFSLNYKLLSSLWEGNGWVNKSTASYASTHYGGYAITIPQGLKIISINTDFWYTANIFNYYNFTNPDKSGTFRFLISELEAAEAANQRVWIIGHVPPGYSAGNPLPNPTALFYSIVVRFSPATIAAVFWGHTHEDQLNIFYDYAASSLDGSVRNTTDIDLESPLAMSFIGPSLTPLTNYNAGWQRYQVDAETFGVLNLQTYISNISNSASFDPEPEWEFEYDARETYDPEDNWPATAPLNATFWHGVTEQMLENVPLTTTYTLFESKSSVKTTLCTDTTCAKKKVCAIRSASGALVATC